MKRSFILIVAAFVLLACQLQNIFPTPTPSAGPRATLTPASTVEPTAAPTAPEATAAPPASLPPNGPPTTVIMATAKDNLRVRAAPSTASPQVGALTKGESVQVVGRNAANDWWQIILPNNPSARGWIFATFASANGPVESLPVVEAGGAPPANPPAAPPTPQPYPYP